jgi:hypothetical protein
MESSTRSRSQAGDLRMVVRAEWSTGPRTSAWDRLWRIILSELDPAPTAGAGQQLGREGDDG